MAAYHRISVYSGIFSQSGSRHDSDGALDGSGGSERFYLQRGKQQFYAESGRGFGRTGQIRPDLSAPGVNISTIDGCRTGSSMAAAITAGAVAQFFQWSVIEGNNRLAESREIRSYFIRGAVRTQGLNYPNREWGYGRLNLEETFNALLRV